MSAIALDDATHAHGRCAFKKGTRNDSIRTRDGVASTGDGQHTVMNTLNNLADAGLDASLVTEISNVLASLANDDASLLGGDDGAEGELSLGIFLVRLRGRFAIGTEAILELEVFHVVKNVAAVGGHKILRCRHFERWE